MNSSRNVSLQIVDTERSARGNELDILRSLTSHGSGASHGPLIIQLLDSFELTSGNGVHQVLVTESVVPLTQGALSNLNLQEMLSAK
jgi:hypothetical protein